MKSRTLFLLSGLLSFGATQAVSAIEVGSAMPQCTLSPIAEGQSTQLGQYTGKVVYVDFWASWCGPCAKSFPFLNKLHEEFHGKGLEIVGVNLDENLDDAKGFLAKYPASFTVLTDASKDKKCALDFAVQAMPSSYVIDKSGKVHHIHLGFKDGEAQAVKASVEKLLQ